MAFGGFDNGGYSRPLAEINMVPLIDVMLVLLVIFIVTAPLLTHAVKIDLPKASSNPNLTQPDNIQIAVRGDGDLFWNGEPVTREEMTSRFATTAPTRPQPEVHIRADGQAAYVHVAQVLSAAARTGMSRIGFVTEPGRP